MFGWLPPLVRCKDPELIDKIGLDAVTFLRFCRLLRWLFTGITLLTCGILLPINVVYNLKNVDSDKRDILSMLTIRDVGGNLLYAHVAVTYLITLMICGIVWLHWRRMVQLRHDWFRSPEYMQSFYARTLAIMHVPKKLQSDEGLRSIFESVQVPYPTTSVHIGRRVGKLPELIEYHNNTVRELEQHLVKYLKGGKLGKKRPTVTIGATLGMGGQKHDAIEYYTYVFRSNPHHHHCFRG
jgi:calcium permeable stress-gated cation channel